MFGKDKDEKTSTAIVGFIGPGMRVDGRVVFEHTVRVEGEVKGEITGNGTLVVGEGATIEAEVKADTAIITGTVTGVIEAATRVEIKAPGRVTGEVRTPNLIIGDGAVFEGNSVVLKKSTPARPFEINFAAEEEAASGPEAEEAVAGEPAGGESVRRGFFRGSG
ncbi:MAG: polymer-forming cytoskeletal protein [Thermodesulfobacteriota bacterium]